MIYYQFCYGTGIAPSVVYGGTSMKFVLTSLQNGCDILIGTPGRISDLVDHNIIGLEGVKQIYLSSF